MNRKLLVSLIAGQLLAASMARGQTYVANLLYPLTTPSGLYSSLYFTLVCDNTGNTIATVVPAPPSNFEDEALFWPGTSSSIELNPAPTGVNAYVESLQGSQQVGYVGSYAALWTGSAASAIDLNPFVGNPLTLPTSSEALGTNGSQQVGFAVYPIRTGLIGPQATFWEGTAASLVNLGSGSLESEAVGTDGSQQVGSSGVTGQSGVYAALWSGTAASYVNLNPAGWVDSWAYAVSNGQQVGIGEVPGTNPELSLSAANPHALLWNGTGGSYVDLNPNNFNQSYALGTNGTQQVGWGSNATTGTADALLWSGNASSYVDLAGQLSSTETWIESTATSIDTNGNVFGFAEDSEDQLFAVEWSPANVPEPTFGLSLLASVGMLALRRKSLRLRA